MQHLVPLFLGIAWPLLIWALAVLNEASSVLMLQSIFGANRGSHQN